MILSHFDDLRRHKEFRERRDLTIRTIAKESGLSQGAVLRVKNATMERVYLSTLDSLCRYFNVATLCNLIEYAPDVASTAQPEIALTVNTMAPHTPARLTQRKSPKLFAHNDIRST